MTDQKIFFGTYAFFGIINGVPSYSGFQGASAVTTIFNLAEMNYAMKREGKKEAEEYTRKFWAFLTDVTSDDISNAANLRLEKKALSMPDAIGYIVAKRLGLRFLTGDKEFEKMGNVEYVK